MYVDLNLFHRRGAINEAKSLAKIEQKAIKETKENLSQAPKEEPKPKKPKTTETGTDSQQDFIRDIQDKLESNFNQKLLEKELRIQKLNTELEKLKMSDLNLDDYQAQRVRALTSIMQEVVKNEVRPDPEEIAKLFGLDRLIQKGEYLHSNFYDL